MLSKKLDNRIKLLIENGVKSNHRSFFVLVGEKSKLQVIHLHQILSKICLKQANLLWCYKNKPNNSLKKKQKKYLKLDHKIGNQSSHGDDSLEKFMSMVDIRYCYFKECHKILGNTFKMCVLQDFDDITPNILCRTIESIEGGGIITILLESMTSLKHLYSLNEDSKMNLSFDDNNGLVPRFIERFILSLSSCSSCLILNEDLNIIPLTSPNVEAVNLTVSSYKENNKVLRESKFKSSTKDSSDILKALCKTPDQASVVGELLNCVTNRDFNSTVVLTAARGRGKSAAIGIALAGAVYAGFSNIFVTSPTPENLKMVYEFLIKGLNVLGYEKHTHYNTTMATDTEQNKAIMRLTVKKEHLQVVQYISPNESDALLHAELVVIDEAAAIPQVFVQALMGPYLMFMSSTVSGYEGTGRAISFKLLKELRNNFQSGSENKSSDISSKRSLKELSMTEPIRYHLGDPIERWLYDLLYLDASIPAVKTPISPPSQCGLYYVNKDMLFSYHKVSENLLKNIVTLLVSSHYRNSPDDMQILSDSPSHHLFVLLPNVASDELPDVYCVVQVAFESDQSKEWEKSKRGPVGDLIFWNIKNLFSNIQFSGIRGVRVVRIATHPNLQRQGYGTHATKQLELFCSEKSGSNFCQISDDKTEGPKKNVLMQKNSLLLALNEIQIERQHYIGVSFGASCELMAFWKKIGFTCVYVSQVKSNLTGEHSCILLKNLIKEDSSNLSWLKLMWLDYRKRMMSLFPGPFRHMKTSLALSFVANKAIRVEEPDSKLKEFEFFIKKEALVRLNAFLRNQCDFHQISDIVPSIAKFYFLYLSSVLKLKPLSVAILFGVGIMRKHTSELATEFNVGSAVIQDEMRGLLLKLNKTFSNLSDQYETVNS